MVQLTPRRALDGSYSIDEWEPRTSGAAALEGPWSSEALFSTRSVKGHLNINGESRSAVLLLMKLARCTSIEKLSLFGESHPPRVLYLLFNCNTVCARPIRATRAYPELSPPTPREYFFHLQLRNSAKDGIRVDRSHVFKRTVQVRRSRPVGWVERRRSVLIF